MNQGLSPRQMKISSLSNTITIITIIIATGVTTTITTITTTDHRDYSRRVDQKGSAPALPFFYACF